MAKELDVSNIWNNCINIMVNDPVDDDVDADAFLYSQMVLDDTSSVGDNPQDQTMTRWDASSTPPSLQAASSGDQDNDSPFTLLSALSSSPAIANRLFRNNNSNNNNANKSRGVPKVVQIDTASSRELPLSLSGATIPIPEEGEDEASLASSDSPIHMNNANGELINIRNGNNRSPKRRKKRRTSSMMTKEPRKYMTNALLFCVALFLLVYCLQKCGIVQQEFSFEDMDKILPQLNDNMQMSMKYFTQETKRPGYKLAQQGAVAHFPVILIPGFVTSGLEVWGGKECARRFFRQRLWVALAGARSFLMERDCWREHMMLDPYTGGDPDGIRLRASESFDAADYLMGTYWVWGKIIENLADVGYTPSLMSMEPYDWRLSYRMLEERDGYLTHLKSKVETFHKATGKKVVLMPHSMGALVIHYFFAWVSARENQGGGGGGKDWVDKHIHALVNIAGSHLGVPKAGTALLSGEMSDTVMMGRVGHLVEQFFGRRMRRDLWATWGSLWSMLPKGSDQLWGTGEDFCQERSEDDPFCLSSMEASPMIVLTDQNTSSATMVSNNNDKNNNSESNSSAELIHGINYAKVFSHKSKHTAQDMIDVLEHYGGGFGKNISAVRDYSFNGYEKQSSRVWHDPTRTPLPRAPHMRIYCLYGTGLPTERAYFYKQNGMADSESKLSLPLPSCGNDTTGECPTHEPPVVIDASIEDDERQIHYGIRFTDGDGSVPLISLGYMCADAWQRDSSGLNPSKIPVTVREYEHHAEFYVDDPMRGGPSSADHVDILGNVRMTLDLLRVVTNFEMDDVNQDQIVSNIHNVSKRINAHPNGGIFKRKNWFQRWLKMMDHEKQDQIVSNLHNVSEWINAHPNGGILKRKNWFQRRLESIKL